MVKSVIFAVILWMAEFIVIAALISEQWSYTVMQKEWALIHDALGADTARQIRRDADGLYDALFVSTGMVETVYRYLIPTEDERRRSGALKDLGRTTVFPIVESRLNVIWESVYQVLVRLVLFGLWAPYLLLMFVPALVDGLLARRIKQTNFAYASPMLHRYSIYAIIWTLSLWIASLFAPFPVPPAFLPVAGAVIAGALGLAAANTQKRL